MKVLRVYWIEKKYVGAVESRKCDQLEHRYKSHQRFTDFYPNTDLQDAKDHILRFHGERPRNGGVVPEYAEIVSSKILNSEPFDKPVIDVETYYQDGLFSGIEWAKTYGKKKA